MRWSSCVCSFKAPGHGRTLGTLRRSPRRISGSDLSFSSDWKFSRPWRASTVLTVGLFFDNTYADADVHVAGQTFSIDQSVPSHPEEPPLLSQPELVPSHPEAPPSVAQPYRTVVEDILQMYAPIVIAILESPTRSLNDSCVHAWTRHLARSYQNPARLLVDPGFFTGLQDDTLFESRCAWHKVRVSLFGLFVPRS